MQSKKVQFESSSGETLSGLLDSPASGQPHSYAIFAHCFTCNKNLNAVRHICNALTSHGFAVLRFDFTGLGESGGAFETTSFSSNISDLVCASEFLRHAYQAPTLLIGHSLGGAAVLASAGQIDSVRAVATIGAPYAPEHVQHLFAGAEQELELTGKAEVNIGGRPFTIGKQFVEDITAHDPLTNIGQLRRALMIMHSPQDTIVEIDNAASIYQAARHPKSFISLEGADHLLSKSADAIYAGNTIAAWSQRYLNIEQKQDIKTDQQVVVRLDEQSGYTTHVQAGKHKQIADEPASVGGEDLGPSPYAYLLAGLGACTAMTLKMYARRKQWDLQAVEVHLDHDKIHVQDCECDLEGDGAGRLDKIERLIEVEGDLDEAQSRRLLEIADRCPVHKTLESNVLVKTRLIEP